MGTFHYVSDQDPVVAGFDCLFQSTDHIGGDVDVKNRATIVVGPAPRNRLELVGDLGGHAPRELIAAGGKDVRCEAARVLDSGKSVGGLVDTSQRERRGGGTL